MEMSKDTAYRLVIAVEEGTNIEKLFKQKMPHEESHDYLIRVNRQPVPKDYVLKENDLGAAIHWLRSNRVTHVLFFKNFYREYDSEGILRHVENPIAEHF